MSESPVGLSASPSLLMASSSPRRRDLLQQIGVRFSVLSVDIDESRCEGELPRDYVLRLAREKAEAGFARQQGALVNLGADTIVVCDGEIFGKPRDQAHAIAMLTALSGKAHRVLSAVALVDATRAAVDVSETAVFFRTISPEECLTYWQTGEPLGKAGGYAVQGYGAVFVQKIEGSYSGVVGLPLAETEQLLREFNVPLWNVVDG